MCAALWFHLGEPCIANQSLSVSHVLYVRMYVCVDLYFLDIILDIALIQRLPKLEKMDCPGTCIGRAAERKTGGKILS